LELESADSAVKHGRVRSSAQEIGLNYITTVIFCQYYKFTKTRKSPSVTEDYSPGLPYLTRKTVEEN
jgi:hypothetical protein